MKIILIILFISIKTASSLKCIQCSGSDEASCKQKQTIEDCSSQFQNPACVTLTYSEKLDKEPMVHSIEKKCAEARSCLTDHCSRLWINCNAVCCTYDACNYGVLKEPEVNQKSKRQLTGDSSSATIHVANASLLFVVIIFNRFFL